MSVEGLNDELRSLLEEWAESEGATMGQVVAMVNRMYGLDLTEVDDDDATRFVEAYESDDVDTIESILREYDVDEQAIEEFRTLAENQGNDEPAESDTRPDNSGAKTNGHKPQSDDSGGMSREEVRQMIQAETPTAEEISQQIQQDIGGGGQNQPDSGGENQNQTQQMIAQALAQNFLGGNGGGQMAKLGEQFQKAALKSHIQELQRPSLGDMMEQRLFERVADEEVEKWQQEMFDGDPFEELEETGDEDSDDSGWSVL